MNFGSNRGLLAAQESTENHPKHFETVRNFFLLLVTVFRPGGPPTPHFRFNIASAVATKSRVNPVYNNLSCILKTCLFMIGLKIEKAIKLTKLIWLSKNIKYMLLPNSNFYNLRQIQFTCTIQNTQLSFTNCIKSPNFDTINNRQRSEELFAKDYWELLSIASCLSWGGGGGG